jgi:hypothetical protein
MNKALQEITLDSFDAEGIIHSDGHFAICERDAKTETSKHAERLIATALAAKTTTYPAHALRSIVPLPCKRCGDARSVKCRECDGTTKVHRSCDHCNHSHECECTECSDGRATCPVCVRELQRGGVFDGSMAAFDAHMVAILVREMASAEEFTIGSFLQPSKKENAFGRCLVIRGGEAVGLVMELHLSGPETPRNFVRELEGVGA